MFSCENIKGISSIEMKCAGEDWEDGGARCQSCWGAVVSWAVDRIAWTEAVQEALSNLGLLKGSL